MTATEFIITVSLSLGLSIALMAFIILRLGRGRRFSGGDMLAYMCLPGTLFIAVTFMLFGSDAPGLYTRTLGESQVAQIQQLTYLTGFLGRTNRLRVDTSQGVYVLDSHARVPRAGDIYIVERQRDWGTCRARVSVSGRYPDAVLGGAGF